MSAKIKYYENLVSQIMVAQQKNSHSNLQCTN